jgi:hypothetical protein
MEGTMASLPNRFKIHLAIVLAVCLGFAFTPLPGYSADVDVYAEGAYNATNFDLYIYADINVGPILSFGVKVNYPPELTFISATKNEAVWYFGNGTAEHSYMDPEISPEGGVIIIGGKLNTNDPDEGVTGNRVLLGKVTFTHGGVTDFSGVNLTYAHGDGSGAFSNFVGVNGDVKDGGGVSFAVEIHERGDANGRDGINVQDISTVRYFMTNGGILYPWIDCNSDGEVDVRDISCIRYNMTH